MTKDYVRVCPVCETENPLEHAYCKQCGGLLADVDFSLPRSTAADADAPVSPPDPAPDPVPMPEPALMPDPAPTVAQAMNAPALEIDMPLSADAPSAGVVCPDPECGQINPPGSSRCLYCDTPLPAAVAVVAPPIVMAAPPPAAAPADFELAPPELEASIAASALAAAAERVRARTLPPALATRFRVVDELVAASPDADLLIVEAQDVEAEGERRVAKVYRRGVPPDNLLLQRLKVATPHVVRVVEHGNDGAIYWEVMEYCRAGNLRALMRGCPMRQDLLVTLARELTAGLCEIHAFNILHRDLKPENVLLRRRDPLSLALTDFGFASLFDGERHFTDSVCAVKYAAPEALSGVIDVKTDWWSLGMILLEAASGRHPFDGLSEQVIRHHLMTRPVEIIGVADARFAHLCRGLLLRNPEERYGAAEVQRWLAGDLSLLPPQESAEVGARPFRVGQRLARNREELARALAENWQTGIRDLERGLIREWLKTDLRDFDLLRSLDDIMEARGESAECRFLRFLRVAAPGLSPIWRGELADGKALVARARQALADETAQANNADARAWQDWLESLFEAKALTLFGDEELAELDRRWRQRLALIERAWEAAREQSRQFRARLPGVAVNFDAAVFGGNATFRFPPRRQWHAPILLSLLTPDFLILARADVARAAQRFADAAPWFSGFARQDSGTKDAPMSDEQGARLLTAWRLRAIVQQEAEAERARRQAEAGKRQGDIEAWRQEVLRVCADFQTASVGAETAIQVEWRLMLETLENLSRKMAEANYPEEDFGRLLRQVADLQRQSHGLALAFDQEEARAASFSDLMEWPRLGWVIGGVLFVGALLFGRKWAWVGLLSVGVGAILWAYWRLRWTHDELLGQMRRLQRQADILATRMKKEPTDD